MYPIHDPRNSSLILMHRKQSNHRGVSLRLPTCYILTFALCSTIRHHAGGLSRNRERHIEEALEGTVLRCAVACRQQIQRVIGRDYPELPRRFFHIVTAIRLVEVAPLLHLHMSPSSDDFFLRKPVHPFGICCCPGGRVCCTCKLGGRSFPELSPPRSVFTFASLLCPVERLLGCFLGSV